jgi:hypothetical protein
MPSEPASTEPTFESCCVNPESWEVGGIGKGSVYFTRKHGEVSNMSSTLSGCRGTVEQELHRLSDGGIFIDSSQVDEQALVRLVTQGPMLVPTGERYRAPVPLNEAGAWDYVNLEDYVKMYFDIGSRIGTRKGNTITWRMLGCKDETDAMTPCTCWHDVCVGCHRLRYYVDCVPSPIGVLVARTPRHKNDHCPECRNKKET